MVEVFKTDICEQECAIKLLEAIHKTFPEYEANFDLEDCDKILRVKCDTNIEAYQIIAIVKDFGWNAEVLPDDDQSSFETVLTSPHEWMLNV